MKLFQVNNCSIDSHNGFDEENLDIPDGRNHEPENVTSPTVHFLPSSFKVESNSTHRWLRLDEEGVERQWKSWWRARSSLERRLILVILVWVCLTSLLLATLALIDNYTYNRKFAQQPCLTPACTITAATMLSAMDLDADPCEDFYQFSCGGWLKNNPIPDGKATWGTFDKLWQNNQLIMKAALEENFDVNATGETSDAEHKAKMYYYACLDPENKIEQLGPQPLLNLIDELGNWNVTGNFSVSSWKLQTMLEKLDNEFDMGGLFSWTVSEDDKNSSVNVIQVDQGGLSLPTRDYYLNKTEADPIIAAYLEYMTRVGILLGGKEAEVKAQMRDIIAFETQLAEITIPNSERRDEEKLYHSMSVGELEFVAPFMNWLEYFSHAFAGVNKSISINQAVIVYAPNYLRDLSKLVADYMKTDIGKIQLQNYLVWQAVKSSVSTLPKAFRDAEKILRKALLGSDSTQEPWRDCVSDVNSAMGFAVGSLFVRKSFHEEGKPLAEDMIRGIAEAFTGNFQLLSWMDGTTRQAAKEKADAISNMIGYPDFILNKKALNDYYKDLDVRPNEYFMNSLRSTQFSFKDNLMNLGEPVNRTTWNMAPATVNAYYTPNKNQIVFPAGILQKPFFDLTLPPALNFGAMGVVVGHELTHAFDDQGRVFDKFGDLDLWWNNDTVARFQERANCITEQYSNYQINGEAVNGKQTLGENIADNGGLKASFHAYENWIRHFGIAEPRLPGLNFTSPQLFFLSFAQVWCSASTKEATRLQILNDPHSPAQIRVRGSLSNLKEFSEHFKCPKGSKMNPKRTCEVW